MKLKNIFFSAMLAAGCLTASAQEQAATVETFNPHWFVQAQLGGQYTLGEISFSDLLSGNAQIAGGYQFTPVWGTRLSLNAWQSKGGTDLGYLGMGVRTWKYNFITPTIEGTCNLTNLLMGYNPKRLVDAGLIAGVGLNIGFGNGEACDLRGEIAGQLTNAQDVAHYMTLCWDGAKARITGKVGAFCDFHVSRRVDLGLEVSGNVIRDTYNSKDANNADWYFNALAGVKVKLGKVTKTVAAPAAPAPVIVEKIVEKPVEKIVEKIVYRDREPEAKREVLRRDIFFNIRGSEISKTEMPKVEDIVAYLNKYPEAKVTITGYADKGTGNPAINTGYAEKRANIVANALIKKFNIAKDRIIVQSKGDSEQPYDQNDLNRVSICIAE